MSGPFLRPVYQKEKTMVLGVYPGQSNLLLDKPPYRFDIIAKNE
jgi:hypothetical protein